LALGLLAAAQALRLGHGGESQDLEVLSDLRQADAMDLSAIDWSDLRSEDAIDMRCEDRGGPECEEASIDPKDLWQRYEDFDERFAGAFREHFAAHERETYMIMAEAREILLVNNALAHLVDVQNRTQADMMTTIVALDEEILEVCQNYSLPLQGRIDCVNLTGWVADGFLGNVSNRFGSGPYKFLTSLRPFLLYNALNASRFGVLNMDADIIIRADLLGYVQNQSVVGHYKILTSDDSGTHGRSANKTNAGLVFAMPMAASIIKKWSDAMSRYCGHGLGDMSAFNALRNNFTYVYRTVKLIPDELIAGKGRDAIYAGHYDNCGRTIEEKIVVMKEHGEWWGSV